ncbi:MAG: phage virion morphogenesis protein [Campylobacterales bacterium]|nr:phage virion morphogenesis protein [Campylobacterales bacterium]
MPIEVIGVEAIQTKLSALQVKVEHMRPIMAEIGNMILNDIDETFEAEGKPKWIQLSRTTLRLGYTNMGKSKSKGTHLKNGKTSRGFEKYIADRMILQKSRHLRNSITRIGSDGNIFKVSNDSVTVGTNLKYAAIHQFGGMAGRGRKVKIPARPFMPIDKSGNLEPSLRTAILSYVDSKLEEAVR